tara:strand:- start:158 stop:451 length:294 start_codon:yes stop_codon:yes gene_type:complete
MNKFIYDSWNVVMNSEHNPLRNIPDTNTRHLVMQLLAWMWCIIFSMYIGSITVFGISALLHSILIAGIVVTVATFEVARKRPQYFGGLGRGTGGEHE